MISTLGSIHPWESQTSMPGWTDGAAQVSVVWRTMGTPATSVPKNYNRKGKREWWAWSKLECRHSSPTPTSDLSSTLSKPLANS